MQSLIDEGRITEEDARTHPHRNLILKALDGVHEADPDLFTVELAERRPDPAVQRRRLRRRSTTAGSPTSSSTGSPDYAAVELVRASLEAGSTDNVTCIVADVVPGRPTPTSPPTPDGRRRRPPSCGAGPRAGASFFRGHRAGDTGELEPVAAEIPDDLPPGVPFAIDTDPEAARYAPREPRRHSWLRRAAGRCSGSSASPGWPAPRPGPGASTSTTSASRTACHDLPRRPGRPPRARPLPPLRDQQRRASTGSSPRRRHGRGRHRRQQPGRRRAHRAAASPPTRPRPRRREG